MSDNIITLGTRIRAEAAASVDTSLADVAAQIRSGTFDKSRLTELLEHIGFREWFWRQGLSIYRTSIVGNRTGET